MQSTAQNRVPSSQLKSQRGIAIAGILLLGVGGATYTWMQRAEVQRQESTPAAAPVIQTVTALGRLAPQGEVINLSAPTSAQGNRVDRLLVQEGDLVKVGGAIAILDSYSQNQAALAEAEEAVRAAQARLNVIRAGAKQGEIEAQRAEIGRLEAERRGNIAAQTATVARLESELRNAQTEFNRYEFLYQQGAISASERDRRRLTLDTTQQSFQEAQVNLNRIRSTTPREIDKARATLEQIAEVRPVDVQAAQVEIDRAIAARSQAKASFERSTVRSPVDGEVLAIHARAGEVVSTDGIVAIGQTQQMQAIAEVYQSDIRKVRVGQPARVASDSLAGELTGTVVRIDSQVKRQEIVNTDPSANIDARTIEVHVNLDDASSQKAAKFTNLQVQVVIEQ